jgi:epsilon-lactone hydrolase
MTAQNSSSRIRPPKLARAFEHADSLVAATDLSSIPDPKLQWLTAMRGTLSRYGDVGPAVSLEGITYTPVMANGVRAEWVTAEGASNSRRIIWIHGGGWAAGSPLDYRAVSATLARLSGASILMVDYRLAPDNPFPAGLDDCVVAYKWALLNGPSSELANLSGKDVAGQISIVGDSAGGNLSAATCIRLISDNVRMPDRLVLIAGTLDNVSMLQRIGIDDPICTQQSLTLCVEFYLTAAHTSIDPLVSPAFAPTEVLARFPPTLLQVSSVEALLHDSKKFANRLEEARVRVNLSLWPELPHVWHAFLGLFPEATEALNEIAHYIRRGQPGKATTCDDAGSLRPTPPVLNANV